MKPEIIHFPKRCPHGALLHWHRRFNGGTYTTTDCATCNEAEQAQQDAEEAEIDAFCERLKARRLEEQ